MTKLERRLIKALQGLLDDLAGTDEECSQETGQKYGSYKYARRINAVGKRAMEREKAKGLEAIRTTTPTDALLDQQSREYRVTWGIDVHSSSPTEAAKEARSIQLDPLSTATVFEVSADHSTESIDVGIPSCGEESAASY